MYICTYVYMCICIYVYVYMYICIYVYVYICIYVSMYVCIYVYTYIWTYVNVYTYNNMYIYIYIDIVFNIDIISYNIIYIYIYVGICWEAAHLDFTGLQKASWFPVQNVSTETIHWILNMMAALLVQMSHMIHKISPGMFASAPTAVALAIPKAPTMVSTIRRLMALVVPSGAIRFVNSVQLWTCIIYIYIYIM